METHPEGNFDNPESAPKGTSPIRNSVANSLGLSNNILTSQVIDRLKTLLLPGSAVVGIGNDLCGDDAAGALVARRLGDSMAWHVYDVGPAPENFLFRIAETHPPAVLVIDAVDFGAVPGSVMMIDGEAVTGQGPGTHGPAPEAFLALLEQIHLCPAGVLGIQPECSAPGAAVSAAVLMAVEAVVAALKGLPHGQRPVRGNAGA